MPVHQRQQMRFMPDGTLPNFRCTGRQHVIRTEMSWMVVFVSKVKLSLCLLDMIPWGCASTTSRILTSALIACEGFVSCTATSPSGQDLSAPIGQLTGRLLRAVVFAVHNRKLLGSIGIETRFAVPQHVA